MDFQWCFWGLSWNLNGFLQRIVHGISLWYLENFTNQPLGFSGIAQEWYFMCDE
jgi:hypothetical protein